MVIFTVTNSTMRRFPAGTVAELFTVVSAEPEVKNELTCVRNGWAWGRSTSRTSAGLLAGFPICTVEPVARFTLHAPFCAAFTVFVVPSILTVLVVPSSLTVLVVPSSLTVLVVPSSLTVLVVASIFTGTGSAAVLTTRTSCGAGGVFCAAARGARGDIEAIPRNRYAAVLMKLIGVLVFINFLRNGLVCV